MKQVACSEVIKKSEVSLYEKPRCLIANDCGMQLAVLTMLMENQGFNVVTA